MSVGAVLFDLDGTLIDSCPDITASLDAALVQNGLPAAGIAKVRDWIGNGARVLVERALADANSVACGDVSEVLVDRVFEAFIAHYRNNCCIESRLYTGVEDLLCKLHQADVAMAIVTNKPREFALQICQHYDLRQYCSVVLGGDSLSTKKPEPAMLFAAAEQLGVAINDCVMVGDSRSDVLAAQASGIPCYVLSYGYNRGEDLAQLGARRVFEQFSELVPVLL